ncbi:MAG: peptidylprolyl isomerase [Acidimicrobiales bacterium]
MTRWGGRRPIARPWVALVAGLALGSACSSVTSYAARVDGQTISSSDLEDELRAIATNEPYLKVIQERQGVQVLGSGPGTFASAFSALALTRQIYYRLIETELERRKVVVRPADLTAAREAVVEQLQGEAVFSSFPKRYQSQLVRREAELDLLTVAVNGAPSEDEAARRYYAEHPDQLATSCVRHILVATQEKADELKRRLDAGEDFAKLAQGESTDNVSGPQGGLVGCDISAGSQIVPEFLGAVQAQPVGAVGAPVQTQFGFHIIKVDSRAVPPYEEVADVATARLELKVRDVLKTMVDRARIEVNPRYGSFDREGPAPGVKPPEAPAVSETPPGLVDGGPEAPPGAEAPSPSPPPGQ